MKLSEEGKIIDSGGRKAGKCSTLLADLPLFLPFLLSSHHLYLCLTSRPPSLPVPLRLSGRMMMNHLAARKQNISSPGWVWELVKYFCRALTS